MNTHPIWIRAQVPPCEAGMMSKAIVFWSTAFLIRDISRFSKDGFVGYYLGLLGKFSKGFYVCCNVLQAIQGQRQWPNDCTNGKLNVFIWP